jgi:hypothetical protein
LDDLVQQVRFEIDFGCVALEPGGFQGLKIFDFFAGQDKGIGGAAAVLDGVAG